MMHEINTPSSERKRGGWVSLFVAIALIVGSMLATADLWRTYTGGGYLRGPVTGTEFAAFLEAREATLRSTVTDYDGLLRTAKAAGERAMIDVLRDLHHEREAAVAGEPANAND